MVNYIFLSVTQALDVIGQVGFGTDFGATRAIGERDEPGAIFELMEQGIICQQESLQYDLSVSAQTAADKRRYRDKLAWHYPPAGRRRGLPGVV